MKQKEGKQILNQLSEKLKTNVEAILGSKINIETVEAEFGQLILANGKPLMFKVGANVLPTLLFTEVTQRMPKIVVDMGAVPYVCKGADVMAPGIRRIEGEFNSGDLVVVVDETHGKALALGESLYDSQTARTTKKGAVVKSLHFVSDKIWGFAKTITA